ncbi:MAG: ATPase [Alphaproteobacteria bacterium]|nr:ATPase [Alphaproteobacteria bacterium]
MTSSVLIALRVKASPERAFDVFTEEISAWWRPDPLFEITPRGDGVLSFEGGENGRLITTLANGKVFEIGHVTEWRRGEMLAFSWRHATLMDEQKTRVEVTFEAIGEETRVSVRHFGWLDIPQSHVARHRFPDMVTQQRVADWWRRSLAALAVEISA